jgi:hypothetical protein
MNKFIDLLNNNNFSKPEDQEEWAENIFPSEIANSNFSLWTLGDDVPDKETRYLLGVALWDIENLKLLDSIESQLSGNKSSKVCLQVFSISKLNDKNELEKYIPTILSTSSPVIHPPVLGIWENGILQKTAFGSAVKGILFEELNIK